jgi:uncharacterized protein (TIGR04255 family)
MIFGFPEVVHAQFKTNFLKVVVFQIQFNKLNNFKDKKTEIVESFKDLFPRIGTPQSGIEISFSNTQTPIVQHVKNEETLELKSVSGQKTLNISNSSIALNVTGKEYQSYEHLKQDIQRIVSFLDTCELKEVNRIAIRKINVLDFKYQDNNASQVLSSLVNVNLLGNLDYYPAKDVMKQNIHTLVYNKDRYNFNIKYGINIPPLPGLGQLIIDFDMFNVSKNPVQDIINVSNGINQEIYNAFNWIATENLLTLLNA